MRILVVYGSKRGGTEGLAQMIGAEFADCGFETVVAPAKSPQQIGSFDAVVIAGALYAMRWHRDARSFARRYAGELRKRPVWLVSSGPLDASAAGKLIPPVAQVSALMAGLGARGHMTFGGRLERDARGFPASAMAKRLAGDWRDAEHVHRWVLDVVAMLRSEMAAPARAGT